MGILTKIFGTRNERVLKSIQPIVEKINSLESRMREHSDEELRSYTPKFKERIERGEDLDSLLPEAFAVVRETARRTLDMRPFDVQLIGGVVLHRGMIAEMKTGEGKTLVATMPAYLNALTGKGVHVVTVNDYLAKRDAEWMGKVYNFLGLSVGVVVPGIEEEERKKAYAADITYGQNNEFGFDYLRDNMKFSVDDLVQRGHNYAIIDEVDSILIDEARTPLIISGPADDYTQLYELANKFVPHLKEGKHFEIDLKTKHPTLTEEGIAKLEKDLGIDNLYDPKHAAIVHHINQSLKAHFCMERDVDYVVKDGEVIIVDEFTGRLMPGRRWSDGLHQAIEAKEGVRIARENQTLASITFQNYFRMYKKLAGMTGTADTEAVEFKKIYDLEVVVIPTNKPMIREDKTDLIFATKKSKFKAVCDEIEECYKKRRPVLVGTVSIEQSEQLSKMLKARGIPHNVLNAKHHEREAEIIAQAGRLGAITIATNMAGRGTDIMLGGNPELLAAYEAGTKDYDNPDFQKALDKYKKICEEEKKKVIELGGLYIIGTERHESRRIDNQLRGRAGRQGDPGTSQFYVSLEDDLMKRFGTDRLRDLMVRFGVDEGQPLKGRVITKSIETAQRRVEAHNFDIRKHLLEYDDVMNKQREVIYNLRSTILKGENLREEIMNMLDDLIEEAVLTVCAENIKPRNWNLQDLEETMRFLINKPFKLPEDIERSPQAIFDYCREYARELYNKKIEDITEEEFSNIEFYITLQSLDHFWKNHLLEMDYLKEGIGLRGYGQKNPLHEYQKEAFLMFQRMLKNVKIDIIRKLFSIEKISPEEAKRLEQEERARRAKLEREMALISSESITREQEDKKDLTKKMEPFKSLQKGTPEQGGINRRIDTERRMKDLRKARRKRKKK